MVNRGAGESLRAASITSRAVSVSPESTAISASDKAWRFFFGEGDVVQRRAISMRAQKTFVDDAGEKG